MSDLDDVIDGILRREGGFVDHPADRGGPTNWGITQATLARWRRRPVTVQEVRELTAGEAREIYRHRYIVGPRFGNVTNQDLRELVVDCGVNHGPNRAARWLQQAAGVHVDGIVGPQTLHAVNHGDARMLYRRVLAIRCRYYGAIISNDSELMRAKAAGIRTQAENAAGWLDHRVAAFIERTP